MTADLLDISAVARRRGVTTSTIRAYLSRGQMPAPDIRLGQTPGWLPQTIDAWLTKPTPTNHPGR